MKMYAGTSFFKLGTLMCALSLLSACGNADVEQAKDSKTSLLSEQKEFPVPVEIGYAKVDEISKFYQTTAILEAERESIVVNKVTGMVNAIYAEEGQFVKMGERLASIDPTPYQLEYERASIDYQSAKSEYTRSQPVNGKQLISEKDLDKLRFRVQTTKNQMDAAKIKLQDTQITSPISGVVAKRDIKAHNMLSNQGSELFHIITLDSLIGVVYLPESELSMVKIGQKANILFPASPHLTLEANVLRIAPLVDSKLGTFKVTLKVDNPESQLKPGMFARVSLLLDSKSNAILIPQTAILRKDGQASIFIEENQRAKELKIDTGYEQNGWVEVKSSVLLAEQSIVTVGQHGLKDNTLIKIINHEKSANKTESKTEL